MESRDRERTGDALERYRPPYDLTADMLVVAALCPTAPLRQTFPRVPFLAVRGKTPLVLWFSRITEVCYCDAAGERRCEGGAETALCNELNIIALLRQRALFVPSIYATSERTIHIGHRYGMPKQPASMQIRVDTTHFEAQMMDGACESFARAAAGIRQVRGADGVPLVAPATVAGALSDGDQRARDDSSDAAGAWRARAAGTAVSGHTVAAGSGVANAGRPLSAQVAHAPAAINVCPSLGTRHAWTAATCLTRGHS